MAKGIEAKNVEEGTLTNKLIKTKINFFYFNVQFIATKKTIFA